jgi:hypothetical protein
MSAAWGSTGASDSVPSPVSAVLASVAGAAAVDGADAVVAIAPEAGAIPPVVGLPDDIDGSVEPVLGMLVPLALLPPDFGGSGPSEHDRSSVIRLKTPRDRFSTSVASRLTAVCRSVMSIAK